LSVNFFEKIVISVNLVLQPGVEETIATSIYIA